MTFTPEDPHSLAEAIAKVVDDPDTRIKLGQRNYLAALGLPIAEVADWYLLHYSQLNEQSALSLKFA